MQKNKEVKKNHNLNLTLYTNINSKCVLHLNVEQKLWNLSENIGEKSVWLCFGKYFWDLTPKANP